MISLVLFQKLVRTAPWWATSAAGLAASAPLPLLLLPHDNTRVTQSCEVHLPPGTVIPDADGNGVLHIVADNITVRFAPGSVLRGAVATAPGDTLRGIGIRIDGHTNVVLQNLRVHGFKCGVVATRADGLRVEGGDFSDNYRQRLRSTPEGEDGADWLFPHHNDERKWREEYGGAVCVERSRGVTIRDVRVRRGQNGILLDRVNDSRIFDNDCSFLSGWGLAMWRSSSNFISRNAFDFCVRGHVEGVYNRGQDSAGILCFEQSSDNVFVENSVTHGGDGFFGFAGREALGEIWLDRERERLRRETGRQDVDDLIRVPPEVAREFSARGCNRNLLIRNDFSDASAHGIELTFSEGNQIISNRIANNAICGLWGGYSSDTLIAGNEFTDNGGMAYGLERGAINMEHASANRILGNTFRNNKCAVHLWWDNDAGLLKLPGVAGNDRGVSGNVIAGNELVIDGAHLFGKLHEGKKLVGLQLRDEPGGGHVRDNAWFGNEVKIDPAVGRELDLAPGCTVRTNVAAAVAAKAGSAAWHAAVSPAGSRPSARNAPAACQAAKQQAASLRYEVQPDGFNPTFHWSTPPIQPLGRTRPVGARAHLAGRDKILFDEWGPWGHESPLIRARQGGFGEARFELLGFAGPPRVEVLSGAVTARVLSGTTNGPGRELRIQGPPGVTRWRAQVRQGKFAQTLSGVLVAARWEVTFFPWTPAYDPRKDLAGWRRLAAGDAAVRGTVTTLDFPYGGGGPRDLTATQDWGGALSGGEHFGMIAHTRLRLPAGRWRLATLSDDGVRVRVNGQPVIENWTWHGPTRNEAVFEQAEEGEVAIEVEHFEIDGYAVLRLTIEPAEEQGP